MCKVNDYLLDYLLPEYSLKKKHIAGRTPSQARASRRHCSRSLRKHSGDLSPANKMTFAIVRDNSTSIIR